MKQIKSPVSNIISKNEEDNETPLQKLLQLVSRPIGI